MKQAIRLMAGLRITSIQHLSGSDRGWLLDLARVV